VICLSDNLSNDVTAVYKGKPFIVNNGIETIGEWPEIKRAVKLPRILFLSNLIGTKGVYDFIDAIRILKSKQIDFEAVMVGAPGDISEKKLNDTITKKQLDSVLRFLGPKYDAEKYRQFILADIFAYPTQKDAFPLVILEAMHFGLAIVSSDEGAIPEIIDDGLTGLIIEKGNPKDLARKLEMLIRNEPLRNSLGFAAKEAFLQKYTVERFQENMKLTFMQIVKKIENK